MRSKKHHRLLVAILGMALTTPLIAKPITLTLHDAILLALRLNTSFRNAQLDRVVQKYALVVARNAFAPQFTLGGGWNTSRTTSEGSARTYTNEYQFNEGVSIKNPYGTTFTLNNTNSLETNGHAFTPGISFGVAQPLLKGFGRAIVEEALRNALDNERINKLNLKTTAIGLVDKVMNQYLTLFQNHETLAVDQRTLADYRQTLENDHIQFKTGKLAKNDLIQVQAEIATQLATIHQDQTDLQQNRFTLLGTLGLKPETHILLPKTINFQKLIYRLKNSKKNLLPAQASFNLALQNNIKYQIDGISILTATRSLVADKNSLAWGLNFTASADLGGAGDNAGYNRIASNHAEKMGLKLTIPINDVTDKQTYLTQKIAVHEAKLNYRDEKRQLEISINNDRNVAINDLEQTRLAGEALTLQKATNKIALLKNQAGLTSTFELNSHLKDLQTSRQSLVDAKISYIQALQQFDEDLGITLDVWKIHLRD